MGNPAPEWRKKPLGTHLGHSDSKRDAGRANRPENKSLNKFPGLPKNSHVGAPQPSPDSQWDVRVKSWWKSIGMSDTAAVYQEIDWMNCWVCADVLNYMYDFGFQSGLLKEWHAMVEKLHVARVDILERPAEEAGSADEDEQEATAALTDISARLRSA